MSPTISTSDIGCARPTPSALRTASRVVHAAKKAWRQRSVCGSGPNAAAISRPSAVTAKAWSTAVRRMFSTSTPSGRSETATATHPSVWLRLKAQAPTGAARMGLPPAAVANSRRFGAAPTASATARRLSAWAAAKVKRSRGRRNRSARARSSVKAKPATPAKPSPVSTGAKVNRRTAIGAGGDTVSSEAESPSLDLPSGYTR